MYLFRVHVLGNFPYCGDQIFNKKRLRGGGAYYGVTAPYIRLEQCIPWPGKHGGQSLRQLVTWGCSQNQRAGKKQAELSNLKAHLNHPLPLASLPILKLPQHSKAAPPAGASPRVPNMSLWGRFTFKPLR